MDGADFSNFLPFLESWFRHGSMKRFLLLALKIVLKW